MIEETRTLPHGREFEKEFFGMTDESQDPFQPPVELSLGDSMQEVILENWKRFAEAVVLESNPLYIHNPSNPQMGRTQDLWSSVKKHLPKRPKEEVKNLPLDLYVAVGRNSLDVHCGVDAFFWWRGVYATLDASLRRKTRTGLGKDRLKAQFLLTPEHLDSKVKMDELGKEIARHLRVEYVSKKRRERSAPQRRRIIPNKRETLESFAEEV